MHSDSSISLLCALLRGLRRVFSSEVGDSEEILHTAQYTETETEMYLIVQENEEAAAAAAAGG